jgi:branched-chain amino acid transport system permease protein
MRPAPDLSAPGLSAPGLVAGLALTGVLAALPLWMSPYHVSLLVTVFMYVALAGSWNLFSGMTGYVSLGHGLFFGVGAYSFAVATAVFKLPPAAGLALGVIVPALVAFLVGLTLLTARIRIAYFAVVMLGLNEITKTIVANVKSIGSSYGLTLPTLTNRFLAYYILLGLAVTVTAFAYGVRQSRWGYGLRAILADEVAAEMTGVRTVAHKLAMFVASAVFIGLTGAVIAWNWSYVDPYMAFDLMVSFDMLVMAMFGGFGTVAGPVLGAVLMSIVKEALSTNFPHFQPIIFGVLVIVLILWCPGGIIQAFEAARAKLRTWTRPQASGAAT